MLKRAETITVGSELTRGQNIDTHSARLARALGQAGLRVRFQVSVGDELEEIAEALRAALKRSELVVIAGGLGPTLDDLTREAIALATGHELAEDAAAWKAIQARFAAAGRVPSPNNRRQALLPRGAAGLPNAHGTAPGLRLELEGKVLFALPGPPSELEPMLEGQLLPWLLQRQGAHAASRRLQVYGLGESSVDEALRGLVPAEDSQSLAMLAKGTYVEVILSALEEEAPRAEAKVEALEAGVLERLGPQVYSLDGRGLEQVVVDLLKEKRLTLALAESCTGGLLASRVCSVPGASEVFPGGLVSYSDEWKGLFLDVPPFVLKKAGAVSKDAALAMAVGLARRSDADYCLAVTGVAGPGGGSQAKPVGTVHFALAGPEGVRHQHYRFSGSPRTGVQARAAQAGLWLLYCALAELETPEEASDRGSLPSRG